MLICDPTIFRTSKFYNEYNLGFGVGGAMLRHCKGEGGLGVGGGLSEGGLGVGGELVAMLRHCKGEGGLVVGGGLSEGGLGVGGELSVGRSLLAMNVFNGNTAILKIR